MDHANLTDADIDQLSAQIDQELLALTQTKDPMATQAEEYRRQARQARAAFAGTGHELEKLRPFIAEVVLAAVQPEMQTHVEPLFQDMELHGLDKMVASLRRILAGDRDEEDLTKGLDLNEAMIVGAVLAALEDPVALQSLLESEEEE